MRVLSTTIVLMPIWFIIRIIHWWRVPFTEAITRSVAPSMAKSILMSLSDSCTLTMAWQQQRFMVPDVVPIPGTNILRSTWITEQTSGKSMAAARLAVWWVLKVYRNTLQHSSQKRMSRVMIWPMKNGKLPGHSVVAMTQTWQVFLEHLTMPLMNLLICRIRLPEKRR